MPFGSEGLEDATALTLSGGGFRAALFHLGTLWRLNELGLLGRLRRVSSVSGGSITAGALAMAWRDLGFRDGSSGRFEERVATPVRRFCARSLDAWAVAEGILLPGLGAGDVLEREYREHLFGGFRLSDLPDDPTFVFNATNLQTGRSFRFLKPYIGDYLIGLVRNSPLPLATAVAASSAFPPFLSPVVIEDPGRFEPVEGAIHNGDPRFTARLHLTDGGAYDNLGLETVWNRCRTVLASDAGAPFATATDVETDWVRQTLRVLHIATDQARGLRERWLVDQYGRKVRGGAYWGIDTDITKYPLPDALPCDPAIVAGLARMPTRLDTVPEQDQGHLVNWGFALCDAALRSYGKSLVPDARRPSAWPCPAQALGAL